MRPIDADKLKQTLTELDVECADLKWRKITLEAIQKVFPALIDDEPTVKVVTKEQYDAAVMRVLSNLRTRAYSAGPFGTADKGVLLLLDALMKCLLRNELFGGSENENANP